MRAEKKKRRGKKGRAAEPMWVKSERHKTSSESDQNGRIRQTFNGILENYRAMPFIFMLGHF
jgi:hypothetical protein